MTIKSDKWIARMSRPPMGALKMGGAWLALDKTEEGAWVIRENGFPVFDSDLERVHEYSEEERQGAIDNGAFKPMIDPFVPEQVKQRERVMVPLLDTKIGEVTAGRYEKIVSYGLSSYGYDVRCGDEFKIFTNINSTVVDPKNFNDKIFVDFKGDVCIIPPNSFALARTVERFRIPRNVLTICLGKSTYARCFSGDTKVALADGTSPTFEELTRRSALGERFWGYSTNAIGAIEIAELTAPRKVGHEKLVAVELDNGDIIRCTPDHKFMTRAGVFVEAKDLKAEDSLMPLYRSVHRGYESVYQPVMGRMISTHWLADDWNLRHDVYRDEAKTHRHHRDHAKRNNVPFNLIRMPGDEHAALHNQERWGQVNAREVHGELIASAIARLKEDEEWYSLYQASQSLKARQFWAEPEYQAQREALLLKQQNISEETRAKHADAMRTKYMNPEERVAQSERIKAVWKNDVVRREKQAEIARSINLREDITAAVLDAALKAAGTIRGAAKALGCDRSVFRRFPEVLGKMFGFKKIADNHKVVSVKEVKGTHDVYCLTVPEHGNFALESGVFVKNCGIIVNVTPFEPEWEGYVTLEFSNTTPLPAKIYAHEGVAQVLFFQSDETCAVSYKDREGKYMNQGDKPTVPEV